MSYSSINRLAQGTSADKVSELVRLLGFDRQASYNSEELGRITNYFWFDQEEYRSWSGVELSVYKEDGLICVETRTPMSRSYFDLEQQNKTIKTFRRLFGGTFETDEGKSRYLRPERGPPQPAESGCHVAFQRFGSNLISAHAYVMNREFKGTFPRKSSGFWFFDEKNPWIISNNLLLPYLVALLEDYFKSTFIALLKSSDRKVSFMKSGRISSEHLGQISAGERTVEEAIAENLSFQRLSSVCKHFDGLDKRTDFGGILRKPYRRRKQSLFESIESIVTKRHDLIHRGRFDLSLSDQSVNRSLKHVEEAVVRCYRRLTDLYGWTYEKWWVGSTG